MSPMTQFGFVFRRNKIVLCKFKYSLNQVSDSNYVASIYFQHTIHYKLFVYIYETQFNDIILTQ